MTRPALKSVIAILALLAGIGQLDGALAQPLPPACSPSAPVLAPIVSTFATGTEGWTIRGDAGPDPEFAPGEIRAVDRGDNVTWYWLAPEEFLGDRTAYYGTDLVYRLRVTDAGSDATAAVLIEGAGLVMTIDVDAAPGFEWTEYRHSLSEASGWRLVVPDRPATREEICRVLADIQALAIRGEFQSGPDTGWLGGVAFGQAAGEDVACGGAVGGAPPQVELKVSPPVLFVDAEATLALSAADDCAVLAVELTRIEPDGSEVRVGEWINLAPHTTLPVTLPGIPGRYQWRVLHDGEVGLVQSFRLENVPGGAVELIDPPAFVGVPLRVAATLPEGRATSGVAWVGVFPPGSDEPIVRQNLTIAFGGERQEVTLDAVREVGSYELRLYFAEGVDYFLAMAPVDVFEARFDRQVWIEGPAELQRITGVNPRGRYTLTVINERSLGDLTAPSVQVWIEIASDPAAPPVAALDEDWWLFTATENRCVAKGNNPHVITLECPTGELAPGAAWTLDIELRGMSGGVFTIEADILALDAVEANNLAREEFRVRDARDALFEAQLIPELPPGSPPVATLPIVIEIASIGRESDRAQFAIFGPGGIPLADVMDVLPNCPNPFRPFDDADRLLPWLLNPALAPLDVLAMCRTGELDPRSSIVTTMELPAPDGMVFVGPDTPVPDGVRTEPVDFRLVVLPASRGFDEPGAPDLAFTAMAVPAVMLAERWSELALVGGLRIVPAGPEYQGHQPGSTIVFEATIANVGTRDLGPFDLALEGLWSTEIAGNTPLLVPINFEGPWSDEELAAVTEDTLGMGVAMLAGEVLACGFASCRISGLAVGESRRLTIRVPTGFAREGSLRLAVSADGAGGTLLPRSAIEVLLRWPTLPVAVRMMSPDPSPYAHQTTVVTLDVVNFGPATLRTLVVDVAATSTGRANVSLVTNDEFVPLPDGCVPLANVPSGAFVRCTLSDVVPTIARVLDLPIAALGAGTATIRPLTNIPGATMPVDVTFRALDGDINDDGARDCADLDLILAALPRTAAETPYDARDLTRDGLVDDADVHQFYTRYPAAPGCRPPEPAPQPAAPAPVPAPDPTCVPLATAAWMDGFDKAGGANLWSPYSPTPYPSGAGLFLGEFGNGGLEIRLQKIGTGDQLAVEFDLLIIRTWDGLETVFGPDYWQMEIRSTTAPNADESGQAVLFRAAFNTTRMFDATGGGVRLAGPTVLPGGIARYRVEMAFATPWPDFSLVMRGQGLQSVSDEAWGIDNFVVRGAAPVPAACPAVVEADPINLLVNGSFEDGPPVGAFLTLEAGSTAIPGWAVTRNTIDYIGGNHPSSHGQRHLDLDGTPGAGGVEQRFATIPNQLYEVSFDLAGNPGWVPEIKEMLVEAAGQSAVFRHAADLNWTGETWRFRATGSETTIRFSSMTAAEDALGGALLDNVSVVPVR